MPRNLSNGKHLVIIGLKLPINLSDSAAKKKLAGAMVTVKAKIGARSLRQGVTDCSDSFGKYKYFVCDKKLSPPKHSGTQSLPADHKFLKAKVID